MIKQCSSVVVLAVLATLGVSGAPAWAATVAPPGSSGVDQYVEVIPSAGGPVPTPQGGSESGGNALSTQTARRLRAQGSDGQALLAIVESTAPPAARRARRARTDSERERTGSTPAPSTSEASPAVPTAVSSLSLGSDVDGMGLLLPALLVGSAAVIGAIFLTRRRRSQ